MWDHVVQDVNQLTTIQPRPPSQTPIAPILSSQMPLPQVTKYSAALQDNEITAKHDILVCMKVFHYESIVLSNRDDRCKNGL